MSTPHEEHAKVFKAFCDEKRLRILELLRGGEKCVCILTEALEIGQSSLSYHMKILVESGLVESRPEGKWTYYRLSRDGCDYAVALARALTTADAEQAPATCCSL